MPPVPATPISPLLISACVSSTALVVGIEAEADRDAVEDQRRLVVDAAEHDRAAAEAELPVVDGAVGRLEMRQKRQAVRARRDLERSDQHAPFGVPLDVDLGRVDRHRIIRRVGVDDVARADRDLAAEDRSARRRGRARP